MPSIGKLKGLTHHGLPGVEVFPLSGPARAGVAQRVLVRMDAETTIPLHTHGSDARMTIVAGSARVLSVDETDGRLVGPGDVVLFERLAPHGFRAATEGMSFISDNDGIVDNRSDACWDLSLVA